MLLLHAEELLRIHHANHAELMRDARRRALPATREDTRPARHLVNMFTALNRLIRRPSRRPPNRIEAPVAP